MPLHFCKEDNFLSALFFGGVWVRVLLGRLRSLGAVAFPWRWLRTRQFLLFSFWRVPARSWGDSAHVKSCFFLFGVCLLSLGAAPHTPDLAFFFLACACSLLGAAPHTPNLAFFFLACTCSPWGRLRTRQFLLFSFWRVPALSWRRLRTRQFLLFSFWRVPALSGGGSAHVNSCFFLSGVCLLSLGAASHTSILAFFFLACTCVPLGWLRTRQVLLFSFWRVPAFP